MAEMKDSAVLHSIVKDIDRSDSPSEWRWTGQQPTVKVNIRGNEGLKFYAEFAFADATFKDTGPVTIAFKVNDQVVSTVRYDQPGKKTFEAAVPPAFLRPQAENLVSAELDKVWIAPQDGARLGLILTKMGLQQR
jgi:hypothetical protein